MEPRGEDTPGDSTDPFDPSYDFSDIDEAVLAAQENDLEVILTISGTPRWANGGKNPNVMPTRVADFGNFSRAIASRYSGRFDGISVRPILVRSGTSRTFSSSSAPQFDARGRSVAPANYAKLAAAAYTGLKAGNPSAQVGIGETSARGSGQGQWFAADALPGSSPSS